MNSSDAIDSFYPNIVNLHNSIYSGEFSAWFFSKGLGQNIIVGLSSIGDPFTLFVSLLPKVYIKYGLGFIMALKVYLAGIFLYIPFPFFF